MQRRFLRGLWIIILAGIALGLNRALPARAQTQVDDLKEDYIFGRQITFLAQYQSDVDATETRFYFSRPEDE